MDAGCTLHRSGQLSTASVYWDEQRRQAFRRCAHGTTLCDLDDWEWTTRYSGRWVGMPSWCCSEDGGRRCCSATMTHDPALGRTPQIVGADPYDKQRTAQP